MGAYDPGISFHGDQFIAGAGQQLASDIATWLKDSRDEQKQKEFNVGLATELGKSGKIAPEELQSFLKLNVDKQGGILAGIARQSVEQRQQQQLDLEQAGLLQRGRIADMQDSRTVDEMGNRIALANIAGETSRDVAGIRKGSSGPVATAITTADGRVIPGHYTIGNQVITDQSEVQAAAADNWKKFNTDVKAATGATYGEWSNAINKKLDPLTGDFVAEFPAQQLPDPQNPGKTINVPGTTRRISGDLYQQLMQRGHALEAGGAAPLQTPGGTGSVPSAAPAGGKVKVKDPNGKVGFIPAAQLEAAKAQGYTAL